MNQAAFTTAISIFGLGLKRFIGTFKLTHYILNKLYDFSAGTLANSQTTLASKYAIHGHAQKQTSKH